MNRSKTYRRSLAQALAVVAAAATLGACAPTTTRLADGTVAYRIECDATSNGLNYCFERAGKSCGAEGFTVLNREGRPISTSNVAEDDMAEQVMTHAFDKNSILIRCGV